MSAPYYPMYPADFEADTSHLTLEEDGAYNRLLRLMWMTPGCSLPDDPAWIARRMRTSIADYDRVVFPLLDEFFERAKGRVFSPRLMREFEKADETFRARSRAGKRGGRPKAIEKAQEKEKLGLENDKPGLSYARGLPEPEPYREEDTLANANAAGGGNEADLAKELFERGVVFLKRHGVAEAQARSVIGKWRKAHSDADILAAFVACGKAGAVDPIPWIAARFTPAPTVQFDLSKFGAQQ